MFQPPVFREDRVEVMHDLMVRHPFAMLVSAAAGALSADHVPLVLRTDGSEFGMLQGHLSIGNPLYRKAEGEIEVLAAFQGPQTYITPSWYPSKQQHGKVVPTWNYAVVHAHGKLRFQNDPDWLMTHLAELTGRHEAERSEPWAVTDAPQDFMAGQLKGLIGFEIEIRSLDGKWKVSQNRQAQDREGVVVGLQGETDIQAQHMSDLVREYAK
ncbi:MAG: FMN-binding negative transcriptional regulator [Pseudomonadota bacterium]